MARRGRWGIVALVLAVAGPAGGQERPALGLADLERLALARNPTLGQAGAAHRAAQGRRAQAGFYPNPLIGYELDDLSGRDPSEAKHFFWFQVPIVTAGKLGRAEALADVDVRRAETLIDVQRLRVLTTVRRLYYEALGAAQLLALRDELARLTSEAVSVTEDLYNVGQADGPDVLAVEMEAQRSALEVERARREQERVWRQLGAAVGDPTLGPAPLAGSLEPGPRPLDGAAATAQLLRDSPMLGIARANVDRARAALDRVRAERIPNLFLRSRLGYSGERVNGGRTGFESGVEIGIPLPLFDRQQGHLASAEADLEHATGEVARVELELRSQLASALREQADAATRADRYRRELLPRAQRAVELYQRGFQQMAAAYPQVLIARRTLYQARAEYVEALVDAWRGSALLDGLLLTGGLDAPVHTNVQAPPPTGHVPTGSERAAD
jgi:cobalt-zinc-cadmium efflux system outer membrane protein